MKKLVFIVLFTVTSFFKVNAQATADYFLLIGTYTDATSKGIHVYRFNPANLKFTYLGETPSENPSYLAISKNKRFVYAVNENGDNKGSVSAFSFNNQTGALKFINKQPTNGDHPCYVDVDASGKNVIATNYSSGSFAVFKANGDGSLRPALQTIKHDGSGPIADRQERSHVHSAQFAPDNNYVFAADLGNDRLYKYSFYPESPLEVVAPGTPAFYSLNSGSGPRHFAFHPSKRFCYVLDELSGKINSYNYAAGELTELQTLISDKSNDKVKGSAEIQITPNGKFLYTSNRGTANDIAAFKIEENGILKEVGHYKTGLHPRNFGIDPSGKFLFAANRDSNNIFVFKIDPKTGALTKVSTLAVNKPVCVKMIRIAK